VSASMSAFGGCMMLLRQRHHQTLMRGIGSIACSPPFVSFSCESRVVGRKRVKVKLVGRIDQGEGLGIQLSPSRRTDD
jgi:hypothetical protein